MASIPTSPNLSRDAVSNGQVAGVLNNGVAGFPRLEIDDFCQDNVRLNLYLLALEALQRNDNFNTDPWCWFQIQGIHGAPDIPWDGIGPSVLYDWLMASGRTWEAKDYSEENLRRLGIPASKWSTLDTVTMPAPRRGDPARGFCNHGSVLFPSWHRGYEAMIEQAIQAKMVEIADRFPARTPLWTMSRNAAQAFRQPYWDYLRARAGRTISSANPLKAGLSMILAVNKVKVRRPTDPTTLVTIDNPLYAYKYPGAAAISAAGIPISPTTGWAGFNPNLTRTRRHLVAGTVDESDNVATQNTLSAPVAGGSFRLKALQERVYTVLTTSQSYRAFATNAYPQGEALATGDATHARVNAPFSIESWHNELHVILGGEMGPRQGSMTFPSAAGHDPVFILHHGNVDRHFALWQAIWPTAWWTPGEMAATESNYTTMLGTKETSKTPLLPFRKSSSSGPGVSLFWNSDDLRDWEVLGYQYDPIPPLNSSDPMNAQKRKDAATQEANIRYKWFAGAPDPANASLLDPAPMSSVEAFTEFPPKFDGNSVAVNLWDPTAPPPLAPTPTPTPAPGGAHTPLIGPMPIRHRQVLHDHSHIQLSTSVSAKAPERKPLLPQEPEPANPKPPSPENKTLFPPRLISNTNTVSTWTAHIRALRHGLATSFTIYILLGDFPPNPLQWSTSPHLVSALHQFVQHNPAAFEEPPLTNTPGPVQPLRLKKERAAHATCSNCAAQEAAGTMVADFSPLTSALLYYIESGQPEPPAAGTAAGGLPGVALTDLSEEQVVPFLKRNLHWRVLRSDGVEISREEVPEFKVFVSNRKMTLPQTDTELPTYEEGKICWAITDSRPGGLAYGEMP